MKRIFQKSNFKQAFKILFILDNSTKLLSFLRNVIITTYYGLSKVTDSFNFAFNLIMTPINLISDAILAGVIPFLRDKEDEQQQVNFIYSVVLINFVLSLFLLIIFLTTFNYFIKLVAPGFSKQEIKLVFEFGLVLLITAQFMLIIKTFEGYFRAKEIFGVTNFINFISAIISFAILIFFAKENYIFISLSQLIGVVIGFILFLIIIPKKITQFDKSVFLLLKFSFPLVLGGGIGIINSFVDKGFATILSQGALSALTYSFLIVTVTGSLIIGPLIGSAYTFIVSLIINKEFEALQLKLKKMKFLLFSVFFLIILGMQYLGEWGVSLLFLRGEMSSESIFLIYELLIIYAMINIFSALTSILLQIFYAFKKVLVPSFISIIFIFLNIILNFLFIGDYGVYALATSTVLVSFISTMVLSYFVKKLFGIHLINKMDFSIAVLLSISCFSLVINGFNLFLHLINAVIAVVLLYIKFKK